MQKQFNEIKSQNPDSILFFRMGDFYEMFGEDAQIASRILGITLTARDKNAANPIPMCGIPYHSAENYLAKLTKAGKKIAICEQIGDPKAPGLVERKVIRIITPGTTFSESVLDQKSNNFALALVEKNNIFGFAFADLSTGDFYAGEIEGLLNIKKEIFRIQPKETILPPHSFSQSELKSELPNLYFFDLPPKPNENILNFFKISSLHSFGMEKSPLAVAASSLLLSYFQETQKTDLKHITQIRQFNPGEFLPLDESTIRNLELFFTLREGQKKDTFATFIDETKTAMGGRKIKNWILKPLLDQCKIEARQTSVSELFQKNEIRETITKHLQEILDIERILARLSCNRANARDLVALKESLKQTQKLKQIMQDLESELLQKIKKNL